MDTTIETAKTDSNEQSESLPVMEMHGVIKFQGIPHPTWKMNNDQYLSLRELSDQIGLTWHRQKHTLLNPENIEFYGLMQIDGDKCVTATPTKEQIDTDSTTPVSQKNPETGVFVSPFVHKDTLLIRLDSVHMYLARLSIRNIASKGNLGAVQWLKTLQEEWKLVLFAYETTKEEVGKIRSHSISNLSKLIYAKAKTDDPIERAALSQLFLDEAKELGVAIQDDETVEPTEQ